MQASKPVTSSSTPEQITLQQSNFKNGVITLISETRLPNNALKEATNCFLYEDGNPGPRWGTNWYGTALPNGAAIDGAEFYQGADGSVHIIAIGGGNIYRSLDNAATWTLTTGATLTSGAKGYFVQASQDSSSNNLGYITTGQNAIARYNGTTTLQTYTTVTPPTGLTAAASAGITGSTYTYYYRITFVNSVGFTQGSTTATVTVNRQRDSWDPTNAGTNFVTLSWTASVDPTVVRTDIYLTDNAADNTNNNLLYLDSVGSGSTYVDNGQTATNPGSTVPVQNTTTGPLVSELAYVSSRLMGVRDKSNKWRVWWTGSGPYIGYFSDAYDGGYIDLQKGSQYVPVKVVDAQDGKGNALAEVWCDSADGRGCVWQLSLGTETVVDTSFTVPTANKIPGSRGTPAPNSVVNVLNDYYYFNYQAFYNLGPRPQLLNLLSTDEISANIRPTLVNQINPSAAHNVSAYYYLAKVFFPVPYNSTTNSAVAVYDTQYNAWLPNAYTYGVERYFQYTDTSGTQHLLFWKPGDNRLSETSASIQGDYGVAFSTSLTTGLISVQKDRFNWLWTDEAQLEFANPTGTINISLLGISRTKGFSTIKASTLTSDTTTAGFGWDSFAWDTTAWDVTTAIPVVYAETSSKRYFNVQKELNAYQYNLTTNTLTSNYILRLLQISGTPTESNAPRQWRLKSF